jgi:hypothetical protein
LDERVGLLDELRATRCTVSIITTYSVDFEFYESVVLRKLNAAGCEHHLLLVDAKRCGEALADPERRPRLAGISYVLVPVARCGAFHPKLVILAGKKSSRVFVGSHNVTFGGFGGNAEITNAVTTSKASSGTAVVTEALRAIGTWLHGAPTQLANDLVAIAQGLVGAVAAKPGSDVALLYSGGDRPFLWDQLRPLLPKKVRRVFVAGPFFDDRMQFVRRVISDLGGPDVIVAVDPTYSVLQQKEARRTDARFVDCRTTLERIGFAASSALHAKVMLFEGRDRSTLVSGSANPSAAAWLQRDSNAEAVIVRAVEPAEVSRLGLLALADAPVLTTSQWSELSDRIGLMAADGSIATSNAMFATEEGGLVTIHGVDRRPTGVRLFFANDERNDAIVQSYDRAKLVVTGGGKDLSVCNLAEVVGDAPGFAVVNHPAFFGARVGGGNVRGDLSAALGAATEDAGRFEEALKIIERAIEEIDEFDVAGGANRMAQRVDRAADIAQLGSRAIKLDQVRRRHARPRTLATGNIAVVIDLLIRGIGAGLPSHGAASKLPEVEESELDPLEVAARAVAVVVDGDALLRVCHRKVKRLVRRMIERLHHVMESQAGAVRATIHLAAVLGVLRWLRRIERELAWLPFGESLIPADAADDLFWFAATYLGLSRPSLGELVADEAPDACEDLMLALGLLGWLGRECGIDVRNLARHPDEDELTWFHWAGALIMLLRHVVPNEMAARTFTEAVGASRGADRDSWLDAHVRLAEALVRAETAPEKAPTLRRPVERGDLVQVNMPQGKAAIGFVVDLDETKVRLADAERDDGRPVLRGYVAPLDVEALSCNGSRGTESRRASPKY